MKSRLFYIGLASVVVVGIVASRAFGDDDSDDRRGAFSKCVEVFQQKYATNSNEPTEPTETQEMERLEAAYPDIDDESNVSIERNAQGYFIVAAVPFYMVNVSLESPFNILNMHCLAKRGGQDGWSAKVWIQ
ncbi:hypothetical protein GGR25_001062 [Kaistia hirudinis]|uniref:Uncharacterized protein n=1 Tax=Kaistia hirudinis TaxID=1293440 RepID=A0A840AL88_9HYPH|nr:hypothetical protein [Kaistia hirudinis]MBB3930023.1 hypothetical protein [Kaistia hirudinis]